MTKTHTHTPLLQCGPNLTMKQQRQQQQDLINQISKSRLLFHLLVINYTERVIIIRTETELSINQKKS